MNKINPTSILVAMSIIGIILLSGCVGDKDTSSSTTKTTPVPTKTLPTIQTTPVKTVLPVTTIKESVASNQISTNVSAKSDNNSSALTSLTADWCKPGANIIAASKGFTIQGLITDNGTSFCYAKSVQLVNGTNTTTNYYFNQNKTVERMNSTSISSNGSASASASSSVNTS